MCAYKSDEDNCDNVFSNSGNSSNTDSSDNDQLPNLNLLSRLGISNYYGFHCFKIIKSDTPKITLYSILYNTH